MKINKDPRKAKMKAEIDKVTARLHLLVDALGDYERSRLEVFLESVDEEIAKRLNPIFSNNKESLMTVKEAAEYSQIDPSTLRTWAKHGVIPHHRFKKEIRFNRKELDEWSRQKYSCLE